MATHEMTLDVDKSVALAAEVVTARTGDTGTVIKAAILKDGSPISGATSARFLAIRPDRTYIEQSASISGGTATVTLDPRALAVPGVIKTAYFLVETGAGTETTPDIWITVLTDAETGSEGASGPFVSRIEELVAELQSIKEATLASKGAADRAASAASLSSQAARDAASAASAQAAAAKSAAQQAQAAARLAKPYHIQDAEPPRSERVQGAMWVQTEGSKVKSINKWDSSLPGQGLYPGADTYPGPESCPGQPGDWHRYTV